MQAVDLGVLMNLAYGAFVVRLRAHLAGAGFDDLGPSFGYVFRILDPGPVSLATLAARLGMTPQGALKIVADMEAKGYVERGADPTDGRVRPLSLSARGRAALGAARAFHGDFEDALGRRLGADSVSAMRAVLADIVATAAADGLDVDVRPF